MADAERRRQKDNGGSGRRLKPFAQIDENGRFQQCEQQVGDRASADPGGNMIIHSAYQARPWTRQG